jgi:hypothetical protein
MMEVSKLDDKNNKGIIVTESEEDKLSSYELFRKDIYYSSETCTHTKKSQIAQFIKKEIVSELKKLVDIEKEKD